VKCKVVLVFLMKMCGGVEVCFDITNLYMCHGGHGRKWCETKYKP